jgi:hypothetical protein
METCVKCEEPKSGKSKYCATHKAEAREAFKAMIAAKSGDKESREQKWADLYARAHAAGLEAGDAHMPTPMIVERHANPLDDSSPVVQRWAPVMSGVCGFAWVSIRPGNSSFALWMKKHGHARSDSYAGGVRVHVWLYNQSMEKKEAYASAFADVLRDEGIKAYAQSRMD